METSIEKLREADWDKLEKDVVGRIRMLRGLVMKGGEGETWDKIANDLILPNIGLLAGFCANVEIEEEGPKAGFVEPKDLNPDDLRPETNL